MGKVKLTKEWQFPVFCTNCREVMWSDRPGEFVSCSCGGAFCDQTPYYGRVGGDTVATFSPCFEEQSDDDT